MDRIYDWDVFRMALLALLRGQNPYDIGIEHMVYFNPPWMLIMLMPLLLLPRMIGYYANGIISTLIFFPISKKLNLNKWSYLFVVSSWVHVMAIGIGNIEWLVWLGVLFPAPIAMLFYSLKPQATGGFIIYTLYREWRTKGWPAIVKAVLPTAVLSTLWLLIWGMPNVPASDNPGQFALFPYSLVVGLPLLFMAIRNKDENLAAASGPFITPYIAYHSYIPLLFASRHWPVTLVLWVVVFLLWLLRVILKVPLLVRII